MKFNDGYWLLRPGVTAHYATEALDVQLEPDRASIAILTKKNEHRGSPLNTPTLTVDLSSPADGVIRVWARHFEPIHRPGPEFAIHESGPGASTVQEEGVVRLSAGMLGARVSTTGQWAIEFHGPDGPLTSSGYRSLGFMDVEGSGRHMVERLRLPVGANVYGFGERFTAFVKNGQVVETWNADGGTASEQAYKSIPFFLTDAGFGVLVNTPARVSFEVASEVVTAVQFSVAGEELEYLVIYGPTPAEIIERYTALTGRPALPPKWSFGLWLTTSFTTDYDEKTVTSFVDGMAERSIPLSVLHFDSYWMRALHWCDFVWDDRVFPDPAGMLKTLRQKGLHTSVWINPYIGQRSPLFREAAEKGYLLRRSDGTLWQWDLWVAGMGIVDLTNPDARSWFAEKVRGLLRTGVDAIKTDFGERIPTDVVWNDGSDPARMHNYYTYLYNRTVFDVLREERGDGEAVVFARSATVGSQEFPVHWGGDCESTYEAMAESLRAGLSLGLSGFGFWSHDIGGFEGMPSPALFKRWVAFGLMSSHSRLHGSTSYRVPWTFDEEAVEVTRRFARLKNRLMPYLWAGAVEACTRGLALMRPMLVEFPVDRNVATLDRQYMLGPDLLVAPVFRDDGKVDYYLPEGSWTNYLTGTAVTGPRWVTERHGFDTLPLLVRPGAVIVTGSREDRPDYDYTRHPTIEVFGMAPGATRRVAIHDDNGQEAAVLEVSRDGDSLEARLVEGTLDHGWTLQWVVGPSGSDRGPHSVAPGGSRTTHLSL